MILLAILIFMSPAGTLLAWALYIGIGFLISGVILIYQGFSVRSTEQGWGWKVFEGILDLFLGFILVANPALTAAVVPFVIGFWGVITGIILFVSGFTGKDGKGLRIVFGILIFIFSTIIMFNPVSAAMTIVIWIGILLLLAGIGNLIFAFQARSLK